jgi:flagellar hook-associated protein 3 FlgL
MVNPLDANAQRFLNDLRRIGTRTERAQHQISSGVRVSSVSDDPDTAPAILRARASLESTKQIVLNLSRVKAESDAAEQALQTSVRVFDRVRALAAQGVTGTATAASRLAIAGEIRSLLDQLVGLSRTAVEGRFVFSGDSDQQAPYAIDWTQTPPVSAYQGTAATRLVEHPNGTTFSIGHTAQQIFESAFQTVDALRSALEANDQPAIDAAISGLSPASENLNGELAYYGTVQNRVAEAQEFGVHLQLQIQEQLSNLQDTDLTAAILELNQSQMQQDAALQSWSRLPRKSLFDYLG